MISAIFFVRQKWGLIRFDLAVSIDGYDQEKLSYLKRVESQKEVVANNPVKAELEVKKVEKKGIPYVFQEIMTKIIQEIVAKKLSTLRRNVVSNSTNENDEKNSSSPTDVTPAEDENATIAPTSASLSFSYNIERRPKPAKTQEVSLETVENNVADLKGLTKMQTK